MDADAGSNPKPAEVPWWRVRMVWLVIGGPAVVVAASFITLGVALTHPDPVITPQAGSHSAEQPAIQARNHAASPKN